MFVREEVRIIQPFRYSTLALGFKQVAVYRNNTISPVLFPNIIYKYAKFYNECYVVIESNDQGSVVCNGLYQELEYENTHMESAVKSDRIGIEMTCKVKRIGCSAIKDILEHKKLQIFDEQTILEVSTFVSRGQSYEHLTVIMMT